MIHEMNEFHILNLQYLIMFFVFYIHASTELENSH